MLTVLIISSLTCLSIDLRTAVDLLAEVEVVLARRASRCIASAFYNLMFLIVAFWILTLLVNRAGSARPQITRVNLCHPVLSIDQKQLVRYVEKYMGQQMRIVSFQIQIIVCFGLSHPHMQVTKGFLSS